MQRTFHQRLAITLRLKKLSDARRKTLQLFLLFTKADKKNKQKLVLYFVPAVLEMPENAFNVSHGTNDTELARDISCKIHRPRKCLQCFIYMKREKTKHIKLFFRWTRKYFTYIHNCTPDARPTRAISFWNIISARGCWWKTRRDEQNFHPSATVSEGQTQRRNVRHDHALWRNSADKQPNECFTLLVLGKNNNRMWRKFVNETIRRSHWLWNTFRTTSEIRAEQFTSAAFKRNQVNETHDNRFGLCQS